MNVLYQGTDANGAAYLHALLPRIEDGVTHLLAIVGQRAILHRLLATGEVISQELNLTLLRSVLQAADALTQPQVQ